MALEREDIFNRALSLSRDADRLQIIRAAQLAIVGGVVGAVIGVGLHVILPESGIGVVVGGIIGWKDAATRAYLLRKEADRLLDQCAAEDNGAVYERSRHSGFGAAVRQRRSS
ncbi:MAG: hypothetical protein P4L57_09615 [Rhizomicrobium sp.]|nr:hypothetical protein [Rhizomicrobium sp.]